MEDLAATTLIGLNFLPWCHFNAALLIAGLEGLCAHSFFDLSGHGQEGEFYVRCVLG